MKRIFAFLLALALFGANLAFTDENPAFNEVCKSISSHKITKGNFSQTKMIKKIMREIKSSGTFIVSANDGVLWNTQKPFKSSMAITKSGIVQTNAHGKKNVIAAGQNATFEQISALMASLFSGDSDSLDNNFQIEFIGSPQEWNINLVPRDLSVKNFIESIEMTGRAAIDMMILHEPSGDFTKYEFTNQIFADSLTNEEKSFFSAE